MEIILRLKSKLRKNTAGVIGVIAVINIFLAVIALLKDMLLASYLGTSQEADAFTLAFFITDMIGNNLLGNAAATSSVPLFSKVYAKEEPNDFGRVFIAINFSMLIIALIVAALFYINQKSIIGFLGFGFSEVSRENSLVLTQLLCVTILLYPIVLIAISALQIKGKFIISAIVPIIFNFIFLLGILLCTLFKIPQSTGIIVISYSIITAVFVMIGCTYTSLINKKQIKNTDIRLEGFKETTPLILTSLKLFFSYLTILFLSQGVLYIERYITSQFAPGSIAAQNYAYRLSQFPVWVFTSAISTVTFPLMAKAKGRGEQKEVIRTFKISIYSTLLVTLPVAIILFFLREPIISILFLRGEFTYESLKLTGSILSTYTLTIIVQSVNLLCIKYYLTENRLGTPIVVFLLISVINSLIDVLLARKMGLMALGVGAGISGLLASMIFLNNIKLGLLKSIKENLKIIMNVAILNGIILALSIFYNFIWKEYFFSTSEFFKLLYVIVVSFTTIGIYLGGVKRWKLIKIKGEKSFG